MRKLIALFTLISQLAYANLPPTTIKGQSDASAKSKFGFQVPHSQATDLGGISSLIETGNTNILKNPGFESGSTNWSAAFTGSITTSLAASGTGKLGLEWDDGLGSPSELTSALVTIPEGFKGKNGIVRCQIKQGVGTITHTMTVSNGTSNIVSPIAVRANASTFTENAINFIFPSSGSIQVKFYGNDNADPILYIDDCELKLADNIGTVAQAQLVGTVKVTGCTAAWSTTSTTYANFATQTGCSYATTGQALAPSTNVPGIRFNALPPGDYRIEYEGTVFAASVAKDTYFQFWDGTNTAREDSSVYGSASSVVISGISQSISYTAPQSNVTLQIRAKVPVATGTATITGQTAAPGVIKLWYFPTQSQQAVSSANADYTGGTIALSASNTQGFGTPTGSCIHDRIDGSLFMNCKFTSGTVSASEARINLPSGLTTADTTRIPSITNVGNAVASNTGANILYALAEPSVGYITFGRQTSTDSGLTKINGNVLMGSSANLSVIAIIPIQGWTANQRAPTLVGSVTSNASGAERIERARVTSICTTSPCTIADQSGSWLTSITRSSIGVYVANFSSPFTAAPTCTVTNATNATAQISSAYSSTTTSINISTATSNTGSSADGAFNIICMGAR